QRASPYSPSHRGLINPLYISIFECTKQAAFSKINSEHISALEILKQEKQQQFINYQLVSETKYKLLKSLYRHFKHYADAELQRKFRLYCQVNSNLLSCLKDDERAKFWQWVANMQLASCQQL
ncbi:4-alpha-glucanotransferase, partial [Pseudoalteromonas sp. S983]